MNSEFRPINGFESYLVGREGSVFSEKTNKELATFVSNSGYLVVKLYEEKYKRKHKSVHRIVAEAFISNLDNEAPR